MLLFRTAAVAGGQRTGGAGRDAALRADAYPVAVSVFRALVAAHRLRRVGAALCAFIAADAAAVRSFGYGRGRAGAGSLRRLPRRRTDSCRACGKRRALAGRGRAAARLLQQRGTGIFARRVRRGRVFVQPRGRGAVSHPCRRGALRRSSHLPRVAAGAAWNISAQKRESAASFHSLSRGGAERADGMPQCERVRCVFHGACAAVAALSAGGLRLIAPLRAAAWIFRAHERRAVASLLARRLSRLRGAARLGRDERPLSNAQHARGLSPLRAVLSQGKGAASAAVAASCPARAAGSVSLTLTAPPL